MRTKLLIFAVFFTSLFGYLEWGTEQSSFLFQSEYEIIKKFFIDPKSVIHPLVILPMFGQLLLLISLIQPKPSSKLIYGGIISLSILLVFILLIGLLEMNIKLLASVIPFFVFSFLLIRHIRSLKRA